MIKLNAAKVTMININKESFKMIVIIYNNQNMIVYINMTMIIIITGYGVVLMDQLLLSFPFI